MAQKAARSLTYYIYHTITVEGMDKAVGAISEISANIQRDHKRETDAAKTLQKHILNNQLSPRAQQIFDAAKNQTPSVNLAAMSATESREYLAKIFEQNSLEEVEDMWKHFLPVITFKVTYNVPSSASAEHADLMKKWRICNRECWLRAMENEIELRCKHGLSNNDSSERYRLWRNMTSQSSFAPFLPRDVGKVPVVCNESSGRGSSVDKKRTLAGGMRSSDDYQVDLQTGPGVDLEKI